MWSLIASSQSIPFQNPGGVVSDHWSKRDRGTKQDSLGSNIKPFFLELIMPT